MKFKLPTLSAVTTTTTTTYPHPTKPGQSYSITYASAEFPDDTPEYAREVWDSWRPMARIVDGRFVIPYDHQFLYDLSNATEDYYIVDGGLCSSLSDEGLDNYIEAINSSGVSESTSSSANWTVLKLGYDTFKPSADMLSLRAMHDSITKDTCVVYTTRTVPLDVLKQLPRDVVIVTTLGKVGSLPLIVYGREQNVTYACTLAGKVLSFKVGQYPVNKMLQEASWSARATYGLMPLQGVHKVLVLQWLFGELVDTAQLSYLTPAVKVVYTLGGRYINTDLDFSKSDYGFDDFNCYTVPTIFSDADIQRVIWRAELGGL